MANELVMIAVSEIYQHPDNPRKDLGDLSELTESIKKKGVMQNLTVIPGHFEDGEWKDDCYTLIIGHRRCAAAKTAGLAEVPCRVVEMDKKEQVSTMLEENMQRSDLTIFEQAQGFQMMLDLGDTEETIAEKTGFSRTTIKHRLNLAKLNQKVLKEKNDDEAFQLSLKDLYELEKIPDVKTRDKILRESTSSNNLAQRTRNEVEELKRAATAKEYEKMCKEAGIKPAPKEAQNEQYSGKWETVKTFELSEDVKKQLGCKMEAQREELFYIVWWRRFYIIKKKGKEKKEPTKEELERKAVDKKKKQIKAMQKEMSAERQDFVKLAIEKKFMPDGQKPEEVIRSLFELMIECSFWTGESTRMKFLIGESSLYNKTDEEKEAYKKQTQGISTLHTLLIYVTKAIEEKDLADWNGTYASTSGALVMKCDEILDLFGFKYSQEEYYKVAEGSHELYVKKE